MKDIRTDLNNTIDLAGIIDNERQEWLIKNGYLQDYTLTEKFIMKFPTMTRVLLTLGAVMIILAILIPFSKTNAYNGQINSEYEYYGVNNHKDYSRKIRLETCYRVGTEKLGTITEKQLNHCATMNTLITAIESDYMQSDRCTRDLNCKGLKGWQNGKYGFMVFDSLYEQNLYFADKWFSFHYKKSLYTLVYGFKQKDGKYKYGWTYTQQDTYLSFLRSKYDTVYNQIKRL